MKYLNLIIIAVIGVITLSIVFFFGLKCLTTLDTTNKLTLTLYFFSGISTLGAVLSAIYTLHLQAKAKEPNFLLETTSVHLDDNSQFSKYHFQIGVKMLNIGESAFLLEISLNHKGINPNYRIRYGNADTRNQFDIFRSITENQEHHYLELDYHTHDKNNFIQNMKDLKPILVLKYIDKNHLHHKDIYLIKHKKTNNSVVPFFILEKC
ncbi:hypothetical protein [Acinetobacter nosocomialis]|uniref:hypothetical protein n=1 Tax=Acinetobacter nosocomialis TaxID=106654 RepID=UPI0026E9AA79|nr:hypothetical protein [Acinetobacter nosocomialis]MDO7219856.1 hypothetical protein [Acinetobacter nosocomialis]